MGDHWYTPRGCDVIRLLPICHLVHITFNWIAYFFTCSRPLNYTGIVGAGGGNRTPVSSWEWNKYGCWSDPKLLRSFDAEIVKPSSLCLFIGNFSYEVIFPSLLLDCRIPTDVVRIAFC